MTAIIDIVGVRKTYKSGPIEFEALRGVDIRIDEGEYVAVIGPSGSGKSTLMNLLGCLDLPTEGTYHLADEDTSTMTEEQLAGAMPLFTSNRIADLHVYWQSKVLTR